jgi:hypothetical protein
MVMPTEAPNKPPINNPGSPPDKPNRLHAEMPQIPGVGGAQRSSGLSTNATRMIQIGGLAAAGLLIAVGIFWWVKSASSRGPQPTSLEPAAVESPAATPDPAASAPAAPAADGPTVAATIEEMAKPWSAKKFRFVKPVTQEALDAMVIRLPNGTLWAFALLEPYGRCELEYVTDLGQLAKQYGYRAAHPMVVNPCNKTIYDPLKVGPLGGDTWVRGEIVQGQGLRPPISIDVQVSGQSIVADKIE